MGLKIATGMTWMNRQKHFSKFKNRRMAIHALTPRPGDEAFEKFNNALKK